MISLRSIDHYTGAVNLQVSKIYPDNNTHYNVSFELMYYKADQGGDDYSGSDNCPSGAYIFKPCNDTQYALPYTNYSYVTIYNSSFVQELQIKYFDNNFTEMAVVRLNLFEKSQASKWTVITNGIKLSD